MNATEIATSMVKLYGMSEKVGVRTVDVRREVVSQATKEAVDAEVKRLLQVSYS